MTIEYCGVEIEADAQIGKDSVPSLTNALWNFLKVVLYCTDAPGAPDISCRRMSHQVIEHSWEGKLRKVPLLRGQLSSRQLGILLKGLLM